MSEVESVHTASEHEEAIPDHIMERFRNEIHHAFALAEVKTVEICWSLSRDQVREMLFRAVGDYVIYRDSK